MFLRASAIGENKKSSMPASKTPAPLGAFKFQALLGCNPNRSPIVVSVARCRARGHSPVGTTKKDHWDPQGWYWEHGRKP